MYLCRIQNTKDKSTAYLTTPYDYSPGEIIYPHLEYHPSLAGHELNRWKILARANLDNFYKEV